MRRNPLLLITVAVLALVGGFLNGVASVPKPHIDIVTVRNSDVYEKDCNDVPGCIEHVPSGSPVTASFCYDIRSELCRIYAENSLAAGDEVFIYGDDAELAGALVGHFQVCDPVTCPGSMPRSPWAFDVRIDPAVKVRLRYCKGACGTLYKGTKLEQSHGTTSTPLGAINTGPYKAEDCPDVKGCSEDYYEGHKVTQARGPHVEYTPSDDDPYTGDFTELKQRRVIGLVCAFKGYCVCLDGSGSLIPEGRTSLDCPNDPIAFVYRNLIGRHDAPVTLVNLPNRIPYEAMLTWGYQYWSVNTFRAEVEHDWDQETVKTLRVTPTPRQ